MAPARLKAFVLESRERTRRGAGARVPRRRRACRCSSRRLTGTADDLDVEQTLRVLEDYKSLDVECAAMGLLLCKGIRERYPGLAPSRRRRRRRREPEGLPDRRESRAHDPQRRGQRDAVPGGLGRRAASSTRSPTAAASAGATCGRTRPRRQYGFAGFSPYTRPDVIEVAEGIPFAALTRYDVPTLYTLKGEIVRRGSQGGHGTRHAGLPEAAVPARRDVGRGDAAASRSVGARLPPGIRAPLCMSRGSIRDRPRRRAIASCSNGAARGPMHDPWRYQGLIVEDERTADGEPRAHGDRAAHGPRVPVALRDVRSVELHHRRRHAAGRHSRAGGRRAVGRAR